MALTYTELDRSGQVGRLRVWVGTITFDSSYPTGGEAVDAGQFGMSSIVALIVGSTDEAGISARWDHANSKLILMDEDNTSGIEAQFANTGDASAVVATVLVFGI